MKITVFGDIMWNYELDKHSTLPVECNSRCIGGTLLKICSAARRQFDKVIAVGTVGAKDYEDIKKIFENMKIKANIVSVPNISTGTCMLKFENNVRTLILSLRQANLELNYDNINKKDVFSSDFIIVNGWSFLPESNTSRSLIRVLSEANQKNVPIIFDILPHHIRIKEMSSDYIRALGLCSVVICEISPQNKNSNRIFELSILHKIANKCKLYILFDWIRSIRVEKDNRNCLTEESIPYSQDTQHEYYDELALQKVLKYFPQVK